MAAPRAGEGWIAVPGSKGRRSDPDPFRSAYSSGYGGADLDVIPGWSGVAISVYDAGFHGFTNPVDPNPDELRAWAYQPGSVPLDTLPPDWDLLISTNRLIGTIFALAADPQCPAQRFALHCLYIYAAGGIRTNFREQPRRKLHRFLDQADRLQDQPLRTWAHNARALLADPDLFAYQEWYEGGLVRAPRRIS